MDENTDHLELRYFKCRYCGLTSARVFEAGTFNEECIPCYYSRALFNLKVELTEEEAHLIMYHHTKAYEQFLEQYLQHRPADEDSEETTQTYIVDSDDDRMYVEEKRFLEKTYRQRGIVGHTEEAIRIAAYNDLYFPSANKRVKDGTADDIDRLLYSLMSGLIDPIDFIKNQMRLGQKEGLATKEDWDDFDYEVLREFEDPEGFAEDDDMDFDQEEYEDEWDPEDPDNYDDGDLELYHDVMEDLEAELKKGIKNYTIAALEMATIYDILPIIEERIDHMEGTQIDEDLCNLMNYDITPEEFVEQQKELAKKAGEKVNWRGIKKYIDEFNNDDPIDDLIGDYGLHNRSDFNFLNDMPGYRDTIRRANKKEEDLARERAYERALEAYKKHGASEEQKKFLQWAYEDSEEVDTLGARTYTDAEVKLYKYCLNNDIEIKECTKIIKFKVNNEGEELLYSPSFEICGRMVDVYPDQMFDEDGLLQDVFNHDHDLMLGARQYALVQNDAVILRASKVMELINRKPEDGLLPLVNKPLPTR